MKEKERLASLEQLNKKIDIFNDKYYEELL
jgi:hypothetical protein